MLRFYNLLFATSCKSITRRDYGLLARRGACSYYRQYPRFSLGQFGMCDRTPSEDRSANKRNPRVRLYDTVIEAYDSALTCLPLLSPAMEPSGILPRTRQPVLKSSSCAQ